MENMIITLIEMLESYPSDSDSEIKKRFDKAFRIRVLQIVAETGIPDHVHAALCATGHAPAWTKIKDK